MAVALAVLVGLALGAAPARASQTDCFSYGYACTPGYNGANAASTWAWSHYGGSFAQTANGYHNCTLYAAFRLAQNGMRDPGNWGNAVDWAGHNGGGDHTPAVGAIAWWGSEVAGGFGHVAYVDQVSGSQVHVVADNFPASASQNGYTDAGWIAASAVDRFLHPHDLSGSASDGSFVSVAGGDGRVYEMVGGAPLYVSSWAAVGGAKPVTSISQQQLDGFRPYPADGTFAVSTATGRVYKFAGGAPEYVSAADASRVPGYGSSPVYGIDQWDLDNTGDPHAHVRAFPDDGTFIANVADGRVYKVAGGAPEYVSAADASRVPGYGTQPVTVLSFYEFANYEHLRRLPADGTFIANVADGRVYKVAGGAPIYVSGANASRVPGYGSQPVTVLSFYEFANHEHLRAAPLDGTVVTGVPSGTSWTFAGGLRSPSGAAPGAVTVDDVGLSAFGVAQPAAGEPGAGTPSPAGPAGAQPVPSATAMGRPAILRVRRHGTSVIVELTCHGPGACPDIWGFLTFKTPSRHSELTAARDHVALAAGHRGALRLRLNHRARAQLRSRGHLKVALRVRGGNGKTLRDRTMTLRSR